MSLILKVTKFFFFFFDYICCDVQPILDEEKGLLCWLMIVPSQRDLHVQVLILLKRATSLFRYVNLKSDHDSFGVDN